MPADVVQQELVTPVEKVRVDANNWTAKRKLKRTCKRASMIRGCASQNKP